MQHLVPIHIQQACKTGVLHSKMQAFTLFADLKGFTALTESMMQQGAVGAEELSLSLNEIFSPIVELVYARGGMIPYFAGDAFTAIFPIKDEKTGPKHLLETACHIRSLFSENRMAETRFGNFKIGIKIGLSFGELEYGIVGNEVKSFYYRGPAVDACAESEHHAKSEEIILDQTLYDLLEDRNHITPLKNEGFYRLENWLSKDYDYSFEAANLPELEYDIASQFLPESVIKFQSVGEFREVTSVFISFEGIQTYDQLNHFAKLVLDEFNQRGGYFKEIDFGDKGGVMFGFFGAPISYENNKERALSLILDLFIAVETQFADENIQMRCGLTSGVAFTGIVGGKERCQYAAVGNRINLAARLMTKAEWGQVLTDQPTQKTGEYLFRHTGDIQYKGILRNVPTYELLGRSNGDSPIYVNKLVKRDEELDELFKALEPLNWNRFGGIVYLDGEGGSGKSRLIHELKLKASVLNLRWNHCPGDPILRKAFHPFIGLLEKIFPNSAISKDESKLGFDKGFQELVIDLQSRPEIPPAIINELLRTKSILKGLLNQPVEEDSLWNTLDPKGRYDNTFQAITNLIQALALIKPLVLVFEDAHWMDKDSQTLLNRLIRLSRNLPILVLISSRFDTDGNPIRLVEDQQIKDWKIPAISIQLSQLDEEGITLFTQNALDGPISNDLVEILNRTTNGNPFYLQEVLAYFKENEVLDQVDGVWTTRNMPITISGSLNTILVARIDRLQEELRELIKAAAVIGREFEKSVLAELMRKQNGEGLTSTVIEEDMKRAERGNIWRAVNELRYIFHHSLLRDAIYSMQLRTRLKELHKQIAETIETLHAEELDNYVLELAYHYEQAEMNVPAIEYLTKAAKQTADQYQNDQALELYDRLLAKLSEHGTERIQALLNKGAVLQLVGRWEEAENQYEQAEAIALEQKDSEQLAHAAYSKGNLNMLQGDYQKATDQLQRAAFVYKALDDTYGMAKTDGALGDLYFRQGDYDKAKAYLESCIKRRKRSDDSHQFAAFVSKLGLTHMNQGNYIEGIQVLTEEINHCDALKDKNALCSLQVNLGIIFSEKGDNENALVHFQKGLELSRQLGNKLFVAIAVGSIGLIHQRKGNYELAQQHFLEDLELCEQLGDKQGTSIALGLLGELRTEEGAFEIASSYLKQSILLCKELGYLKGLAKAENTLGDISYHSEDYDSAIDQYQKAIDIAERIDNQLILAQSYIELALTFLKTNDLNAANANLLKAESVAHELGNSSLQHHVLLVQASLIGQQGNRDLAQSKLEELMELPLSEELLANCLYEMLCLDPKNEELRTKAETAYQRLYQKSAKFIYAKRLKELHDN